MLAGGLGQVVGIHIAKPGDLHLRMGCDVMAVGLANGADHTDAQHAELAIGRCGARPTGAQQANRCGGG